MEVFLGLLYDKSGITAYRQVEWSIDVLTLNSSTRYTSQEAVENTFLRPATTQPRPYKTSTRPS